MFSAVTCGHAERRAGCVRSRHTWEGIGVAGVVAWSAADEEEDSGGSSLPPLAEGPKRLELTNLLAGSGAGAVAAVFTQPLDMVKTRLQTRHDYQGMWSSMKRIMGNEGPKALYRGLPATLIALCPNWAAYFTVYEVLKYTMATGGWFRSDAYPDSSRHPYVHVLSAMGAGVSTASLMNPLWVVKVRWQSQRWRQGEERMYKSLPHAFKRIYADEGLRGFYKGLTPSLIGVLHVCVQFPIYEYMKNHFADAAGTEHAAVPYVMLSSVVSKLIASVVAYPHEVLRAKLQNQHAGNTRYTGLRHAITTILEEEGAKGLYRGMGTNLTRVVPASVITITSYQVIHDWFEDLFNA